MFLHDQYGFVKRTVNKYDEDVRLFLPDYLVSKMYADLKGKRQSTVNGKQ